jgi:hypothetical protein
VHSADGRCHVRDLIPVRLFVLFALVLLALPVAAQDLVPGAYTPGPIGFNVATIITSVSNGGIAFDPALPVEDGHATIGVAAVNYNRTFNLAGRFASVGIAAPFVVGHIQGILLGSQQETSRTGRGDASARIAINLVGAPAMTRPQFAAYRATTLLGVSVAVGMPVGQYDAGRTINIGTHRWSIKPEVGFSRTRGRWTFEGDAGMVVFTDNSNFRGGTYEQAPIVSAQGHLTYGIRPGLWVAADGNFWNGGRTTTNGITASEQQRNSRLGATVAVPIYRRQLRIAYSLGAYTRVGGDFSSIGVSYSYAWTGRPWR